MPNLLCSMHRPYRYLIYHQIGICKSDGTIFDFVGYGPIHSGELAFGAPLKYVELDHDNYTD